MPTYRILPAAAHNELVRQAMRSTLNLVNWLKVEKDVIQANKW